MRTKVEKCLHEVLIFIGDDILGYSGTVIHKNPITGSSTSFCGGNAVNNSDQRLITVDVPLFMWRIEITDPTIIDEFRKEPNKDRWEDIAFKVVMKELSSQELFLLIKHTTNMIFEKGVKKGKQDKLTELHEVLGLYRLTL